MTGRRKIFLGLTGICLAAVCMLTACNLPMAAAVPTSAAATRTPVTPTATATVTIAPSLTATPTLIPTATPTATRTPQLTPMMVASRNAFCRKGPGAYYHTITYLKRGDSYNIIGRNGFTGRYTWWLIQVPGNVTCWVGGSNTLQGPSKQAPVATAAPLPQKLISFDPTVICQAKKGIFSVVFDWVPVKDVTGYNLYRNGSLLEVLPANAKAYQDKTVPWYVELVYELEPFNEYGTAPIRSVTISACGD
jgi:hypothetical protein